MLEAIINSFDIWVDAQGLKTKGRVKSIENISLEGIARLRKLILELAVRGKLISQHPNDESAIELLERIKAAKEKTHHKMSENDVPYKLPINWAWCSVEEIIELRSGDTVHKDLEKSSGEIPYVKVGDMNLPGNENTITTSSRFVDRKPNVIKSIIPPFSIVFPKRGGAIATNKKRIVCREIIVDLNTMAMVIPEPIFDYTRLWFDTIDLWELNNGTSVPQINNKDIYPLLIPIPPLQEQHRIVAKVAELMTLCDKLEEEQFSNLKTHQVLVKTLLETLTQAADATELQTAWERISAHFDTLFYTEDSIEQLKQTILQLAVMGKLVKQDPNDDPASELLKKIAKEKERLVKEGVLKKQDSLSEISEDKKPFELPNGWEFCTLGDIASNIDYGTSEKADLTSEVPVLRMGNVQDGKIVLDNLKYVSRTIADLPRLFLKKKDLIFNRTNSFELVGKCGIFEGTDDQFTLASYLIRVSVLKEFVSIDFINFYINSIICRTTQIEPQITQQTGQANFSGSKLKNILLPLSPFAEQQRIVAKIDKLFALCDSLKEKIQKSQHIKVLLSKTVVEKAVL